MDTNPAFQFQPPQWTKRFGLSVWHEYSALARKFDAVNLGQGFPNFQPPEFVVQAGQEALNAKLIHTYARPNGHLRLVNILSEIYSPLVNQKLNPETQFQVTTGASGAIFVTMLAVLNLGDEVIVLAPWFDLYDGAISAAGGVTVEVPLRLKANATSAADWVLNIEDLRNAITPKTKAIIVNSPHNPTGKIFSREELLEIANVVKKNPRMVVIADEVYEFIIYEQFHRMCTLPGMWERTINVSSAGKVFAITGWKIGWVYGPEALVSAVSVVHQFAAFSISSVSQEAVAISYERALKNNYFQDLKEQYLKRRGVLMPILKEAGLNPLTPQGSFFIVADISNFSMKPQWGTDPEKSITKANFDKKDWNFCRWLTTEIGVTAIPCSAFFLGSDVPVNMVRFTFCKTEEDLARAAQALPKIKDFN